MTIKIRYKEVSATLHAKESFVVNKIAPFVCLLCVLLFNEFHANIFACLTPLYIYSHRENKTLMSIIIIIIKPLFSEDFILSTDTYLTYGPLNIKIT